MRPKASPSSWSANIEWERLTGMFPGAVDCFPQIPASVPILVVQLSDGRKGYVHLDGSLAIDPGPSCPGPVENHLSAYFAWDVLPLEVAIIPLKFVFRHRARRKELSGPSVALSAVR